MTALGSSYLRHLKLAHAFAAHSPLQSLKQLLKINYEYAKTLIKGNGRFVYSSLFIPGEILAACDLVPTPYEPIVGVMASTAEAEEMLRDAAGDAAFPCDICSYQVLFKAMLQHEQIPVPRGFAVSTFICEDVRGMCEYLAELHGRELFVLDVPYSEDAMAVDYLSAQLKEMGHFLAAVTEKVLTAERLKEAIRRSNEALRYKRAVDALRMKCPGIIDGASGFQLFTLYARFGLQSTVDIFRALYEELSSQRAPPPKRGRPIRLLWVDIMPWYSNKMLSYLKHEQQNVAIVYEELNGFDWCLLDEERPWESLARKILQDHRLGSAEKRVARISEMARAYQVDGVVCFSHTQCPVTPTTMDFIGEALRELHVPFVELHGNVIDRRDGCESRNMLKLQAFMEMLP